MTWEDRIAIDPQVPVGKLVIKGTRIAVEFVADLLARGWTVEQILHEYDHLAMEDIQACLAYASDTLISGRVYPVPSQLRNQMLSTTDVRSRLASLGRIGRFASYESFEQLSRSGE